MSPITPDEARARMQSVAPDSRPSDLTARVMREGRRRNRRDVGLAAVAAIAAVGLGFGALSTVMPTREAVPIGTPTASATPSLTPSASPTTSAPTATAPSTSTTASHTPTPATTAATTAPTQAPRQELPTGFALFGGEAYDEAERPLLLCGGDGPTRVPALASATDQQLGTLVSETGESGQDRGAFLFPDEATARAFVAQFRARAEACIANPYSQEGTSGTVVQRVDLVGLKANAEEALQVATEFQKPDGSNTAEDAAGRVWTALRRGNAVVIVAKQVYFADPVTSPDTWRDLFNAQQAEELLATVVA